MGLSDNQLSVSECLQNLALSDADYGRLKGRVKWLENRLKIQKSIGVLEADAKSTIQKEHMSYASKEYQDLNDTYRDAVVEMETLGARRKSWELTIEVWRSQNANKRKGNI